MTAHVAGSDSGFTQDSQTVLRGRADVETRFGLLSLNESIMRRKPNTLLRPIRSPHTEAIGWMEETCG
jgi:hypothetical protein